MKPAATSVRLESAQRNPQHWRDPMKAPDPVIVLPGITGTVLTDYYPVDPEPVWTLLKTQVVKHGRSFERSTLHPDERRYERIEPARVLPTELLETIYAELIESLRTELRPSRGFEVPVYPFPYDWRHPLERTSEELGAFVEEVIDRTSLMRHYHDAGYTAKNGKVSLVGHSMGGMVIAGYLARYGRRARAAKVVTLGTPFRGSFEAPLKCTTGHSSLFLGQGKAREREAARLTPALYHLVPTFSDLFIDPPPGTPDTFFDVATWQPSILRTLAAFIERHSLKRWHFADQARDLLTSMLDEARRFSELLEAFTLPAAGLEVNDWLCIVGVGSDTRWALKLEAHASDDGSPALRYDLRSTERANHFSDGTPAERIKTGDGTVPYRGARCSFLPAASLVCVTPDGFRYFELADKALTHAAGLHGALPTMDLVHRLVTCHLRGTGDKWQSLKAWPSPELEHPGQWSPPIPGLIAEHP